MTAIERHGEDLRLNLPRINTDEHGSELNMRQFEMIALVEIEFLFSNPWQSV